MRKSRRKEKPILSTLLIMALVLNSTMAFLLLANRERLTSPPARAAAEMAVAPRDPVGSTHRGTENREHAVSTISPRPPEVGHHRPERRPNVAKPPAAANAVVKKEEAERKTEIVFLPWPRLYSLTRDTVLVARNDGTRLLIPKGTMVRVAGFADGERAFVVSRKGRPDGFIPKAALGETAEEKEAVTSSPVRPEAAGRSVSPAANLPVGVAGGPYGGSVSLGPAYIYVSRSGQVSGSFSR